MDILFRGGYGSSSCYFWPGTCLFVCCLAGLNIYEINIIRMTSKYQSNLRSLKTLRIAVGFWLSLEPNAGQRGLWMTEFSQAYERGGQRSTWKWGQGGFWVYFWETFSNFFKHHFEQHQHFLVLKCSFLTLWGIWLSWNKAPQNSPHCQCPPAVDAWSAIKQETVTYLGEGSKSLEPRSLVNFRDSNNCLKSFAFEVKWNPI